MIMTSRRRCGSADLPRRTTKTCPNCGCRVYRLGCVNCDEAAYIAQQEAENRAEEKVRR
jgi:hypothetical protein